MAAPQNDRVLVTNANFDEESYLKSNPDLAQALKDGKIESARAHFDQWGRNEGRTMMPRPSMYDLATQVQDLEVMLKQVLALLGREADIPPPPPKHLQVRVVGNYVSSFFESGFTSVFPDLNRTLKQVGKELKDFPAILDFGCGCGRGIRSLWRQLPGTCKLYGTDIDGEAIQWLQQNYSKFGEFSLAPHVPPLVYEDRKFDLVYGISVLTHLPEDMQFLWLKELRRITKPGGYVILTTHGEKRYKQLDAGSIEIMKSKGFIWIDSNYGKSISLPDFYQTAFHNHDYIRREWSKYLEVLGIEADGLQNKQDIVLLRNPA